MRGAHRDRRARGHRRRDGRAVLGQRLRRASCPRSRVRAARRGCSSGTGCACARVAAIAGDRGRRGRGRRRWSTCCARPTSAPTWASSSRRPAPTSTAPRSCSGARRRRTSRCSATRVLLGAIIATALLVAYLWWVRPRSLRPVVARVPTARATALALPRRRGARLRAQRLRHHHPRHDGRGDRERGGGARGGDIPGACADRRSVTVIVGRSSCCIAELWRRDPEEPPTA